MIELTPNGAVMLYLGITVAVILGIWLSEHLRSKHKTPLSEHQKLYTCEYCHFLYLEDAHHSVTQCPQCTSYNKIKTS